MTSTRAGRKAPPRPAPRSTPLRSGSDAARGRLAAVALILLWTAPIVVLPGVYHRWGWPTLLAAVVAVGCAVWVRPAGRLPGWWSVAAAVVAAMLAVRALFGDAPLAQLLGRAPRYEGFVEAAVLIAAVWAGARLLGPRAPVASHLVTVRTLTTASCLLAGVAVLETIGWRPIETDLERPGSLAGNATDQGILGLIFAAWLLHNALGVWLRTRRTSWWAVVGGAAGVVAVVTSASRAVLLGLAVVVIVIAVRSVWSAPRRAVTLGWVTVGVAAVAGLVVALPFTRERVFGVDGFARKTVGDRLVIWRDALELVQAHPWTGVGMNGYMDAIPAHFDDTWYSTVTPDHVLDSPHNLLLQSGVVAGVPGMALVLLVGIAVSIAGVRALRAAEGPRRDAVLGALTVLAGAGIALLMSPTSPKTLLPLAVVAGVVLAREPWSRSVRGLRVLGTAAVATWLVALTLWTAADGFLLTGVSSAMRGDTVAADAAFGAAVALRSWDADIPLTAAQITGGALQQGMAGAGDSASRWSAEAAARLPRSAAAREAAGMVALQRGELLVAREHLHEARVLSPANPRIWHESGLAELAAGDASAARDAFERVLELQPDRTESRAALAEACRQLGAADCG